MKLRDIKIPKHITTPTSSLESMSNSYRAKPRTINNTVQYPVLTTEHEAVSYVFKVFVFEWAQVIFLSFSETVLMRCLNTPREEF